MSGARFDFWLQASASVFNVIGYMSGVAACFSIRQPNTRASLAFKSKGIFPSPAWRPDIHFCPQESKHRKVSRVDFGPAIWERCLTRFGEGCTPRSQGGG